MKKCRKQRGALTIEASISYSIFMMIVVTFLYIMRIVYAYGLIQHAVAQTAKEERKIPVMKMSSLGVSIKNPQRDQVSQNATTTYVPKVQQPEEDFMFNDRDLNYYWQEYAGQLPKEQDALAKRMQMLRPALLNNSTTFEVVVDNEFAAKDFTALIPELQDYLRGRLKNSKVMMTVRVSEATETVRPVGRVEKFQMMAQKNQALMQLKDEFGLELY